MNKVHVATNPYLEVLQKKMRNRRTSTAAFRECADAVCLHLLASVILKREWIEELLAAPPATKARAMHSRFVVVSMLHSGIAMVPPAMRVLPGVRVGFMGFSRDETTSEIREYYWKVPRIHSEDIVLVLEPVLTADSSMLHALKKLDVPESKIRIVSLVATPKGVASLRNDYPNVHITVGSIDEELNDCKGLQSALRNFGDRYFKTE